eukprot:TRINITY_DN9480_c0_g1_i1.p1 TRINITY_DN9480_c0_g1~~TRINITY_DN9480_c0_g1_i1.p1  ORF type:complete len:517 (+),score=110.96 TRINITY_DN9480_c0_g1_i1:38-1552(+)
MSWSFLTVLLIGCLCVTSNMGFPLSLFQQANQTDMIKVVAYSKIISELSPPGGDVNFVDNFLIDTIEGILPQNEDIDVATIIRLFSSTFYVAIFIVVFVLVILSILIIGILQCFCSICGSSNVRYGKCQRGSTYLVNFLLLFTIAIASSLAIYLFFFVSDSMKSNLEEARTEAESYYTMAHDLVTDVERLNELHVYNVSIGKEIMELYNATSDLHNFLDSNPIEGAFQFNYIPVIAFSVLIVMAIASCFTAYFNVRVVYIIIAYLFFFAFFALALSAITTVSYGAFTSNFCASGIDSKMVKIIDSFQSNDTCLTDIVKKYVLCDNYQSKCDPWSQAVTDLDNGISYVQAQIDSGNDDPKYKEALPLLQDGKSNVIKIGNCTASREFYVSYTDDFCLRTVGSLVNFSTILELLSLVSFLFLLAAMYTWNRIKAERAVKTAYDYEVVPSAPKGDHFGQLSTPQTESDGSVGCALHIVLMIIFWGAFVAGSFIVLAFGGDEIEVPRQ